MVAWKQTGPIQTETSHFADSVLFSCFYFHPHLKYLRIHSCPLCIPLFSLPLKSLDLCPLFSSSLREFGQVTRTHHLKVTLEASFSPPSLSLTRSLTNSPEWLQQIRGLGLHKAAECIKAAVRHVERSSSLFRWRQRGLSTGGAVPKKALRLAVSVRQWWGSWEKRCFPSCLT